MKDLSLPFSHQFLLDAVKKYPPPSISTTRRPSGGNAAGCARLSHGSPGGFWNHFAVKALPNRAFLPSSRRRGWRLTARLCRTTHRGDVRSVPATSSS
jgi:hypothetical protein